MPLSPQLLVGGIASLVVIGCILVHYEVMSACWRLAPRLTVQPRARVIVVIASMIAAHVVEVWIFGCTYWGLARWPELGQLQGDFGGSGLAGQLGLLDSIYFSVTAFTTLGFGDIVPAGAIRVLVGAEALAGLSLITWSASFTFLEMQRDWREVRGPEGGGAQGAHHR